ncbi:MAG: hypothetical protein QM765_28985 [Myxococcales bacterium]
MCRTLLLACLATLTVLATGCPSPPGTPDAGQSCAPLARCKSQCVDLQTDEANCGICGEACSAASLCIKAQCYPKTCANPSCSAGQVCVGNKCVEEACVDVKCGTGEVCSGGTCKSSCVPDAPCTPAEDCKVGTTACSGGVATCNATGNADDGTPCGQDQECRGGACVAVDLCADVTCTGVNKHCDPATGRCVRCLKEADCSGALPHCDLSSKRCVECLGESDCAASTVSHFCDRGTKTCTGCASASDCTTAAAPACLTSEHRCVACVADLDCASDPAAPFCDPARHTCVACAEDADCGFGFVCDPDGPRCVECLADADCKLSLVGPLCDTTTHRCLECRTGADCPFERKGCESGLCGSCQQDSDCPGPTDLCGDQRCHCLADSDCGGNAPVCDVTPGVLVCGCTESSQCPTGRVCDTISDSRGTCVVPCTVAAGACDPLGQRPFCNSATGLPLTGLCVACRNNEDCVTAGLGSFCTLEGCLGCLADSDCTDPAKPKCRGTCVGCGSWQDCPAGQGCNFATHTCGSCVDEYDCPSTHPYCEAGVCKATANPGADAGTGPCPQGCQADEVCDSSTDTCVQCLADTDCAAHHAPLSLCDTVQKVCVHCKTSEDCPYSAPSCFQSSCLSSCLNNDCKAPLTGGTDLRCHCATSADCGGDAPVCLPSKTCGCSTSADCGAGMLCNPRDGACHKPCSQVPCRQDSMAWSCSATGPYVGLCLPCESDAACAAESSGGSPYCTPYGCAKCRTTADCPASAKLCKGVCMECESFSDCASPAAGCNSTSFTCGSCVSGSDCPSGSCVSNTCR